MSLESTQSPSSSTTPVRGSLTRRTVVRGAFAVAAAAGLGVTVATPAFAATSQNGWPAAKGTPLATLTVGDASFAPGVRKGDVHTILGYVARRFNSEVEKLVKGTCWGFAYRDISGSSEVVQVLFRSL